jgi:hypothetical protein
MNARAVVDRVQEGPGTRGVDGGLAIGRLLFFGLSQSFIRDLDEGQVDGPDRALTRDAVVVSVDPVGYPLVVAVAIESIGAADLVAAVAVLDQRVDRQDLVGCPRAAERQPGRNEVEAAPYPRDHSFPGEPAQGLRS